MILDAVRMAWRSLRTNRIRSLLTMLGIIVGIAAVIAVVSIGEGGKDAILGQFRQIGANQFLLEVTDRRSQSTLVTPEDLELLRSGLDGLEAVSALRQRLGLTHKTRPDGSKGAESYAIIAAIDPWYTEILELETIAGRQFTDSDHRQGRPVLLLSESTAQAIFGTTEVVGRDLELTLSNYRLQGLVVGVVRTLSGSMQSEFGQMADSGMMERVPGELFIPLATLERLEGRPDGYAMLMAASSGPENTAEVAGRLSAFLRRRHPEATESSYRTVIIADILQQVDTVIGYITAFIAVVAGISLVVGGIGVMNIMLVSVTERTREIGIRRAVGARTRDILTQILAEATVLTAIGGILGVVLGLVFSYIVTRIVGFGMVVDPRVIALAVLFASAVGLFFGLYPARRAARLDPIEALRHE
ncbi:MAG: ABC transporter permease [Bacillota bacterium]|nr:ABC transporter permease [Bacillota bacterium]